MFPRRALHESLPRARQTRSIVTRRHDFHMLPYYSFTFILVLACAVFFYRAGAFEASSGLAWAALSLLISVAVWQWLHGGFIAVLLSQIGLFVAITLYRSRKKP